MMEFTFSKQLNYLVHVVDNEYVAHCLDMDLIGTGETEDEAIAELNATVRAQVLFAIKSNVFDILGLSQKAPKRYWDLFSEASKAGTRLRTLEINPAMAPVTVQECNLTYCLAVAA
jgi:hypothetical protein